MNISIQQILVELTERIVNRAEKGEIFDLDAMAAEVNSDCKEAAINIIIEEYIKGTFDFSLFESEKALFDTASGTQIAIHNLGVRRNFSIN